MKHKTIFIGVFLLIGVVGVVYVSQSKKGTIPKNRGSNLTENYYPETDITHAHGLAVDGKDPNRLYVATHHGLLVLINEKNLYRIGQSRDDYMGFSSHPADPRIFFSSGHPQRGGNIGFARSVDGAVTWQKVSDGVGGPVDFHAMAVSGANPNLIYGWYGGNLQKSTDQGKTWQVVGATNFVAVRLAADPQDENKIYAASPQGLFVSSNQGTSWQPIGEFAGDFVATVAVDPTNGQNLLAFSEKRKLSVSRNSGSSWESQQENFEGGTILHLAFDPQNPATVYALTEKNILFKSLDGGDTWNKIR